MDLSQGITSFMSTPSFTHLDFADLPIPAVLLSAEGNCVYCNQPAKQLTAQLELDNCINLIPAEFRHRVLSSAPLDLAQGAVYDTIYTSVYTYRWQVIGIHDNCILFLAYNLTDRENYRAILEHSVDGVYQTNREGKLVYANQSLADTFGYANPQTMCDQIENLANDLYAHQEDRKHFLEQLDMFGQVKSMELRMRKLDGSLIWIRLNGKAIKNTEGRTQSLVGTVHDITAQKDAESALTTAEEKFRSIFENSLAGLHQSTLDGRYLNVNQALARILGYDSPEECISSISHIGKNVYVRPHEWLKAMKRLRKEGYFTLNEVEIYTRDGQKRWVAVSNRLVKATSDQPEHIEGSVMDVTDSKRALERIQYLAHYDSLTTLPNRVFFHNELSRQIEDIDDGILSSLSLILIDLDNFKDINDTQGHVTGDMLLIKTAHRLQDLLGNRGQAYRLGGDEFAVILPNISERGKISEYLQAMMDLLSQPVELNDNDISCNISAGVAVYPEAREVILEGDNHQQLFRYADLALYRSKSLGRNRFTFFAAEMQHEALKEQQIEQELKRAIENDELCLHYQPLLHAKQKHLIGSEVLVRWPHPERGLIPPFEFIPIAEKTGLITRLDDWVLEAAIKQIATWLAADLNTVPLSVNISANRLNQRDFAQFVQSVIHKYQIPSELLCIEITEQNMIANLDNVHSTLALLRQTGVKVALDDFGTGYSSLSYLKRLPVDKLKIDRSFVMEMHEDPQDRAIIKTVLELGHGLGIWVNAEGVENQVQVNMLQDLGVDEFQGFFFSRPLPLEDFEQTYLMQLEKQV